MSTPKDVSLRIIVLLIMFALAGCARTPAQAPGATIAPAYANPTAAGSTLPTSSELAVATQEGPLTPEANPAGDIPDTQAFVKYVDSPGKYSLDVPEGWARTNSGSDVHFVNKFDGLSVSITPSVSAPTADSVRQNELATPAITSRAFQVGTVTEVDLPGGHAIKVTASVNSEPDPVTGKQVRLEEDIYIFFHNGSEAMLQLWAPQGADNVDQWKRISESFQWK